MVKRHGLGVLAAVHPAEPQESESNNNNNNGEKEKEKEEQGMAIGDIVEWIYEGEWKDDMMHGRGVFRFPSGAVFDVILSLLIIINGLIMIINRENGRIINIWEVEDTLSLTARITRAPFTTTSIPLPLFLSHSLTLFLPPFLLSFSFLFVLFVFAGSTAKEYSWTPKVKCGKANFIIIMVPV